MTKDKTQIGADSNSSGEMLERGVQQMLQAMVDEGKICHYFKTMPEVIYPLSKTNPALANKVAHSGIIGMPDFLVFLNRGVIIGIECKLNTSRLQENQQNLIKKLKQNSFTVHIIKDLSFPSKIALEDIINKYYYKAEMTTEEDYEDDIYILPEGLTKHKKLLD